MKKLALALLCVSVVSGNLTAQVCDPSVAPTGLTSTFTPGLGALLEWDVFPGSVGVQVRIDLPSGSTISQRIVGPEVTQFLAPDAVLSLGTYTWRVQASCSTTPPYDVSLISAAETFDVAYPNCGVVTDIDGNIYSTVVIGSQCWMQENLKVEHYSNGSKIPKALGPGDWYSTSSGAAAVYQGDLTNKDTYGLMYNWYAVDDSRKLCPSGWHVPTDGEWTELTDFLGGSSVAGGKMKATGTFGTGTGLWFKPNEDATNTSGFSGLPGGRRFSDGGYSYRGPLGYWWSSSEFSTGNAWYRGLRFDSSSVPRGTFLKRTGVSVRCLQD